MQDVPGQRLDRDSQQDDPPDRDAHLAAGDRVIATVLQPEVDDQQGGEQAR